jgi:hypothetical protein
VESTSVALSNHEDEATNLPQTTSTMPHGIDTAVLQQARCYSSTTVTNVSSSPWVNLRANDFATQCPISEVAEPTRSPSLRSLRAIFKRTSAGGLTGSHRQRAESLKEHISEPWKHQHK